MFQGEDLLSKWRPSPWFTVMEKTIIHIKNMVCARCIRVVEQELEQLGIAIFDLELGRAEIEGPISVELEQNLEESLSRYGFLLLKDSDKQLVERIKHAIIKIIHREIAKPDHQNFSDYLSEHLGERYSHLSKVFSEKEHITINRYVILQKIERAKELISYGGQSLSQIALELGYSSVAHFSRQFKKVTAVSPSDFRQTQEPPRKGLDEV